MSSPPLRFLPEAATEVQEASAWYDEREPGLGAEFLEELALRIKRIQATPGAGRLEDRAPPRFELRWYDLKRFPYSILTGLANSERLVVAVAHQRRQPGYWKRRLVKLRPQIG